MSSEGVVVPSLPSLVFWPWSAAWGVEFLFSVFTDQAGAVLLLLWLFWMSAVWLECTVGRIAHQYLHFTSGTVDPASGVVTGETCICYML